MTGFIRQWELNRNFWDWWNFEMFDGSEKYPGQGDFDDFKFGRWAGVDKLRGSLFAVPPTPVPAEGAVTTPPCEEGSR